MNVPVDHETLQHCNMNDAEFHNQLGTFIFYQLKRLVETSGSIGLTSSSISEAQLTSISDCSVIKLHKLHVASDWLPSSIQRN